MDRCAAGERGWHATAQSPQGCPEVYRPGAPLFRFVHHAEAVWADGWLHAVVSDTDDGRVKVVGPQLVGRERVPIGGRPVEAKRYALRGQIQRDLWYDADRNLVRVAWRVRDGSEIVLEPRDTKSR